MWSTWTHEDKQKLSDVCQGPHYSTTFNIAMTAEEEAAQQENLLSQDELITKVEGTKISFGKALIDQ